VRYVVAQLAWNTFARLQKIKGEENIFMVHSDFSNLFITLSIEESVWGPEGIVQFAAEILLEASNDCAVLSPLLEFCRN
jgi:hypothetical protein